MELLSKKNGAIFFVDILGMSALTNSKIDLSSEDYSPWLDQYSKEQTDQFLAASILAEFRNILMDLSERYSNVTVSQLSDCAFIWSESIKEVVLFTSNFMTAAARRGILCRGGLTYGEIIETNQKHNLGRFIVGKAVTDAAKLEGISKGCRVLIDQKFPSCLREQDKDFADRISPLFAPFVNPLDYTTYDEFRWYVYPDLDDNVHNLNMLSPIERIELTKERLKVANVIRCSPKFNWNSKSTEGLTQIRASISFISANKIFDILHNFEWTNEISKRNEESVISVGELVDQYPDYKLMKKPDEIEWME